ncbi:MAG: aspartate kinase [Armatimonadetes bacterium]|nr:aspartate kinase [Armatimonadota bacterium]
MPIKVMKFGGTSVATPEMRETAAYRVISAKEQGYRPVVVVSAIGRKGAPYATDTLIGLLREIDPDVSPDPRELDLIMACGEILSAVVFAHTLKTLGLPARAFRGGQAGILTDRAFGSARITGLDPVGILSALEEGAIPVVCGFQGVYLGPDAAPTGELTTLGRGGSDTTASAIGIAVRAEAIEIFTDVDGVKTADPDYVPHAPTLSRVSYEEVAEMAHLGAKVVHPRAAEIAMRAGVPLWIKRTDSDDRGTEVVSNTTGALRNMTGVTHTGKLIYLQFNLSGLTDAARSSIQGEFFTLLGENGINLFMVNVSPESAGFAVSREQFPEVRDLLNGLVIPIDEELFILQVGPESVEVTSQARLMARLKAPTRIKAELTEGCTMMSLIGRPAIGSPGLFANLLQVLADEKIPVLQTSDSELSVSVLIPESEIRRAVLVAHQRFGLGEAN